ncbi:hypothetical protein [Tuwongella immobilis]|uniref:Uncharacterized protein n=1 Tax=Tuwongella immobilis TaxID=692036 RepID=A0A6C2YIQ8_9BACT|nr:hypothetical protein [Tuwongella immobilis]VIP01254.1 unnamed protein product [Tuwongella immobilis]VTR97934.1 unnamed protein product [Tuwongella immobilis]
MAAVDRWVLTISASDRWQPSDLVQTPNQGDRVNPDRFGELLHSWVSWWHAGPLGSLLQQTIRGLCQEFRKKSSYQLDNPADPPDTITEL